MATEVKVIGKNYVIQPEPVRTNVDVWAEGNSIAFKNKGTGIAFVNNYPLDPTEFISFGGNEGETDVTKWKIVFAPGAATNEVWVFRKKYS